MVCYYISYMIVVWGMQCWGKINFFWLGKFDLIVFVVFMCEVVEILDFLMLVDNVVIVNVIELDE